MEDIQPIGHEPARRMTAAESNPAAYPPAPSPLRAAWRWALAASQEEGDAIWQYLYDRLAEGCAKVDILPAARVLCKRSIGGRSRETYPLKKAALLSTTHPVLSSVDFVPNGLERLHQTIDTVSGRIIPPLPQDEVKDTLALILGVGSVWNVTKSGAVYFASLSEAEEKRLVAAFGLPVEHIHGTGHRVVGLVEATG